MSSPPWVLSEGEPSKFGDYYWYEYDLPARKFYSFIAEVGRRLRHLMTDPWSIRMIEFCEQCAEGVLDEDDLAEWADDNRPEEQPEWFALNLSANALYHWVADREKVAWHGVEEFAVDVFAIEASVNAGLLLPHASFGEVTAVRESPIFASVRERTELEWGGLIRCIYGPNPFVPQPFSPSWRTEHTTGLAAKMYDDRDFAAMPILADALEEAGCDNAEMLTHCREPGVHVRGCWVVDLVLGKV